MARKNSGTLGAVFESGGEVAENWRNRLLESLDQGQKNLERQKKRLSQLWS